MSGYLDQDTFDQCHQSLRDGGTLEELAGKLHFDCELLGRLLQLPQTKPAAASNAETEFDLWAADRLAAQL